MKKPGTKISRRRFLGGVSVAAAGTFSYAHFWEARWLEINRVTVPLSNGTRSPLRLLHISDLHASPMVSLDLIEHGIETGLQFEPDLICITGDYVTGTWDEPEKYVRLLRRLSNAAPCFAILGNHDGGEWARVHGGYADLIWAKTLLNDSHIPLLHNARRKFAHRDWELNIVGVGDAWAGPFDPTLAFSQADEKIPAVLLSHNPDTKAHLLPHKWDLLLCGHTHGGQLRVPLIGTPFAPVEDKRFVQGLHRWENRWLHITKGIGNVFGVRINCRPEVSFLTLT
jgi:predicted MPP superfamily phosphohydrolase